MNEHPVPTRRPAVRGKGARYELDGLPGGLGLNIAREAINQHAATQPCWAPEVRGDQPVPRRFLIASQVMLYWRSRKVGQRRCRRPGETRVSALRPATTPQVGGTAVHAITSEASLSNIREVIDRYYLEIVLIETGPQEASRSCRIR